MSDDANRLGDPVAGLGTFEHIVKNLLKMRPEPHKKDSDPSTCQSSKDDQSFSKRDTKELNLGGD